MTHRSKSATRVAALGLLLFGAIPACADAPSVFRMRS
jgi:hypothetical protein